MQFNEEHEMVRKMVRDFTAKEIAVPAVREQRPSSPEDPKSPANRLEFPTDSRLSGTSR